jgi:hypothetical protein
MRALVISLLVLGTTQANACAVCFQNNHARTAYLATTGALLLLPITLVGGFIIVIRRRMKAMDAEDKE